MLDAAKVTEQRIKALERLAERLKAATCLVFLTDETGAHLSYAINAPEELLNYCHGASLGLSGRVVCTGGAFSIADNDQKQLTAFMIEAGIGDMPFQAFPLVLDTGFDGNLQAQQKCIGYVIACRSAPSISSEWLKAELDLFTLSVHASRSRRIIDAVATAQRTLTDTGSVDDVLQSVGALLKGIISAKECYYHNRNTLPDWIEVDTRATTGLGTIVQPEAINEKGLTGISRTPIEFMHAGEAQLRQALHVPLTQPAFLLKSTPFVDSTDFIAQLDAKPHEIASLMFLDKDNDGYLQSRFSATDRDVAQSVFGYLDQYASAKTFQQNYQKVLRFLRENASIESIDPAAMLQLLRALSISFTNVFALTADYEGNQIDIQHLSASRSFTLSKDYAERLKSRYLSKFFSTSTAPDNRKMMMGIDRNEHGHDLEFHFPNREGNSRLYVVRFEGAVITESVLRSLMHFFSELQVRTREFDFERGRAHYLMQVRHAVVHHFAAANKWITQLRPRFQKGRQSRDYWMNLREDPLVSQSLTSAQWSLSQARIILENGRFLLNEINPSTLNRKPFNLLKAVQDAFQTLDDQRIHKSLVINARITGSPPQVMNADDSLMRIAILNLVDNALKFSPNSKTVSWEIRYNEDSYTFSITNSGAPISAGQKERIKQVGVRGRQLDHLNQKHGTGLGLPVAEKILRAHNPETELDITPMEYDPLLGTPSNTFRFTMPYLTGQSNA